MLAARLAAEPLPPAPRVLDLCTGSGVLAIAAARAHPGARVVAVDISRRATLAATLNARLNGVRVRGRRGDLFAAVGGESFDLIVSNPPYIPGPSAELPRRGPARAWEAGPTGRAFLDRICSAAPAHLRPGGVIMLVHNAMCDEQRTVEALRRGGLEAEVVFRHEGSLGPILRGRAQWLRDAGLLGQHPRDEVIIVRGRRPSTQTPARPPAPSAARRNPDPAGSARAA